MYVWNKHKESLPLCKYNCKWKCFVTRLEVFSFQVENKMKWCHLLSNFPQKEQETKVKWENFVFVKNQGCYAKALRLQRQQRMIHKFKLIGEKKEAEKYWVLHKSPTNVDYNAKRVRIFHLTNIDTFQPKIDKLHLYIKKLINLQSFIFTFQSAELRAD